MSPELITEHFIIRALAPNDLLAFSQYRSMPEVAQYQSWGEDYSLSDAKALLEGTDYAHFGQEGHWYQLAIADRESEVLFGDLAVHFIDEQQVEIGFTLAPQYQGKGIACEAVNTLLAYLFNTLNKHRVIAITDTKNRPSCQLVERLNFRKEAHFMQNVFFKGAWGDEYVYAMLKSEY
ncbi:GNAT family N-acetyltransferase [Shewanella surugensis]|uniref:GNAT family N-acetyltransferase n=1 Tax=Shewanella surugensis TaxID=212020 RepID=A0ABT0LCZ2_9GAMM|nr:GNAT family protein [Shewanella surugensis]MCL1125439.1 GNAT family N-acetyltransferase [Shewanella surugensis]